MKLLSAKPKVFSKDGKFFLLTEVPPEQVNELNKICNHDKPKEIEVKFKHKKRSLTANGYLWILCDQLAKKLIIPKGDMYVKMLKRYGRYHEVITKDVALTALIKSWDVQNTSVEHTESLCEVTKSFRSKGILWHELHCYEGSSEYEVEPFSQLLQGVISECELIGIQTMTPQEINQLMQNYKEG